ncbi:MAG: glycosyltransferase 87 family protein [Flavobacteriales bacterium]
MVKLQILTTYFVIGLRIDLLVCFTLRNLHLMKIQKNWVYYVVAALALVYIYFEAQRINDFHIFYSSSQDYFAGKNMYEIRYQTWNHYLYSPFFAILMYPLTCLPYEMAHFIWLSIGLVCLVFIFKRIRFFIHGEKPYTKTDWIITFIMLIIASRFIRDNFHFGQSTFVILFTCTEGVYQCLKGRYLLAGLLFGLGINIKIMPLVFIPWLFVRGYYKVLGYMILFLSVFYILPALVTGWEQNQTLLSSWSALLNPARPIHLLDIDENSYHSISSLMPALFTDLKNNDSPDVRRHILLLDHSTVVLISNITRALVILLTLCVLVKKWFQPVEPSPLFARELAYIFLATPLVFPHQQVYAFLFALPAIALIMYELWKTENKKLRNKLIAVIIVFALCVNLGLWLGEFKPVFEHYKIVTYGALLMLVTVLLLMPKNEPHFGKLSAGSAQ